ncbi:ABC transporter substrate-binding protein [Flavisphingomonas formosensis]|uniref:ABC transporter substrate-binding protein n=1 Tax=Flavisphingomonas formosensis TaxID=861534 RepID=UPI0012FA8F93|nr:ABC transporter substrate-binding protein [Sphingomonas formosensis]
MLRTMETAHPSFQPGRREALRRIGLAGLGTLCAAGVGSLWVRAAQQGAFSAREGRSGFSAIDHQLGWTKGVQFGGDFMAQEQGFFDREKLNVYYAAGGPGTDYRTLVSSGRSLVSESNPQGMIEAALQGQPLVAFAAIYQRDPGCIISPAARPIRSLRDMVGRTIGLPNSIRGQIGVLMRRAGLDADKVRFVPVGSDASMLVGGQVDGYFNWATTAVPSLTIAGFPTHVLHMCDIGAPSYGAVLIARRDRLEKEFELFVRYTRALIGGWGWMVAHPRETARIVVEKYADPGRSLAEQTLQAETIVPYVTAGDARTQGLLWLDPAIFEANLRIARDAGQVPADRRIDIEHMVTQDVVKAAHAVG